MGDVQAAAKRNFGSRAARHEECINLPDKRARFRIERGERFDAGLRGRRLVRGTTLNVFGAIAETLTDRDGEPGGIQIGNVTVGPIASPGAQIEAENSDLFAARDRQAGWVLW